MFLIHLTSTAWKYKASVAEVRFTIVAQEARHMENWKLALVIGSIASGVGLLLNGKKAAGLVAAGIGAAVLASEYPEKVDEIRERIPEYAERGMRILENLSEAGEKIADLLEKRGRTVLKQARSY
jgi:hypothetical protein